MLVHNQATQYATDLKQQCYSSLILGMHQEPFYWVSTALPVPTGPGFIEGGV